MTQNHEDNNLAFDINTIAFAAHTRVNRVHPTSAQRNLSVVAPKLSYVSRLLHWLLEKAGNQQPCSITK